MMERDDSVMSAGRQLPSTADHSVCQEKLPDRLNKADPGANVRAYYHKFMYDGAIDQYYGHSDFHNFGIWRADTDTAEGACRALIEELVALSPLHPARVLEVGCGKGATTRELRAHWPNAEITAIDVSEIQLETCRQNCPDASFVLMDACDMTFRDSSFDVVVSVEAAFHFPCRRRFLEHAHRILVPAGRLVLQDVLHHKHDGVVQPRKNAGDTFLDPFALLPSENYLSGPKEYEAMVHDVGFERCQIIDVTAEGPRRFYRHFLAHLADRGKWDGYDPDHIRRLRLGARLFARKVNYCLLVGADVPD